MDTRDRNDSLNENQKLLEHILTERTKIPFSYGDISLTPVFDPETNHYLVLMVGWDGNNRIHGPLIHLDLRGDKFWIEYDGTEDGIATDLLEAGIPKDRIVLAFQPPNRRKFSGFAIA
jgi:hypothetical protein